MIRPAALVIALGFMTPMTDARGQDLGDIRPGSTHLSDAPLLPFVAVYQIFDDPDGERQPANYWKWHLQESTVMTGRPAWRLVWSLYFSQVTVYDQSMFLQETFEPVSRFFLSHQGNDVVEFDSTAVRWTHVPPLTTDSAPTVVDVTMDGVRFAGGGGLAMARLPLREGTTFRMAGYATDPVPGFGQDIWSDNRVTGRETIEAAGRRFETWVVESGPWTMWIAQEAPYVIRRRTQDRSWELMKVVDTSR